MKKPRASITDMAKALMSCQTQEDAYLKVHPEATSMSAKKNAWRMANNPQVKAEIERLQLSLKDIQGVITSTNPVDITKENLIKLYYMVIQNWVLGRERTGDAINAIKELSKLVPDFVDRKEVNTYAHLKKDELAKLIKEKTARLGNLLNPSDN